MQRGLDGKVFASNFSQNLGRDKYPLILPSVFLRPCYLHDNILFWLICKIIILAILLEKNMKNISSKLIRKFFKMFKWFFDYLYWFQIFKDQWGSVLSIPVAVLDWCHILHSKEHSSHSLSNFKYFSFFKGIPSRMEWSACRSSNFNFTTTCNARRFDRAPGMFKRYLLQIFKQLSNPSLFHSFFFPYFHGQNKYKIWISVQCRETLILQCNTTESNFLKEWWNRDGPRRLWS